MVVRRATNHGHRPRYLYPAYVARCRKLWREQGANRTVSSSSDGSNRLMGSRAPTYSSMSVASPSAGWASDAWLSGLEKPLGCRSRCMSTCCGIRPDMHWRPGEWTHAGSNTSSVTPRSRIRFATPRCRLSPSRTSGATEGGHHESHLTRCYHFRRTHGCRSLILLSTMRISCFLTRKALGRCRPKEKQNVETHNPCSAAALTSAGDR